MNDTNMFEQELIDKLLGALGELPKVAVRGAMPSPKLARHAHPIDAEIGIHIADRRYVLLINAKKTIYPRDAHQVLWQMPRLAEAKRSDEHSRDVIPMLAAQSISPGAKELLRNEGMAYYDTGGSLFIPASGAFIYVEKPPPKTLKKSIRSLFRGKRSQVLHTLLMHHQDWFGVKEIAKLAEVSPATASETLTELERFEWLDVKGQGPSKERHIAQPDTLLNEWQKQIFAARRRPAYRRSYVPAKRSEEIAKRLADICETRSLEYVLTQEIAAQLYAPFLSSISRVTCRLTSEHSIAEICTELEARPVNEGANLDIIATKSRGEFLFKEQIDSLWAASPIQVYLDLLSSGGRAKELAGHLRDERIGF